MTDRLTNLREYLEALGRDDFAAAISALITERDRLRKEWRVMSKLVDDEQAENARLREALDKARNITTHGLMGKQAREDLLAALSASPPEQRCPDCGGTMLNGLRCERTDKEDA
jgi:hypothetical protein